MCEYGPTSVFKPIVCSLERVLVAAFCSEIAVITLLSAIFTIYRFGFGQGGTDAQYQEFAQLAGYYVAAPAAALSTNVGFHTRSPDLAM